MISLPLALTLAAAVFATSFLSGIFGMAGGMILMGILLAFMPLTAAMVLHGLTQMASNGWRAWLWRGQVRWAIVGWYAAGSVLAAIGLAAVRFQPNKGAALIIIGLLPMVGLLVPGRFAPNASRTLQAFGCGAICTALQLLAGVCGPVLDVFFVRSGLDRRTLIATKAAAQVLGHSLKVVYFGTLLESGVAEIVPMAVILAIALALVGTQLSRHVLDVISDVQFRRWSRNLIALVAAIYLVQGLSLLLSDLFGTQNAVAATTSLAGSVPLADKAPVEGLSK